MLVVRYSHSSSDSDDLQYGIDHVNLMNSYEPENLIDHFDNITSFSDADFKSYSFRP